MFNNFHIAALVKAGNEVQLFHIPLHQDLQRTLAASWEEQYDVFLEDVQEVDFDAGYTPEEHERFRLRDFDLPEELANESSETIHRLNPIMLHEDRVDQIRAIVGFAQDADGAEVVLFQNFTRSHVIRPGGFLFLQNNTYESVERPGFTLDRRITAVYRPEDRKLLFSNFRTANTFLPLAEFYEEASERDIREVLEHDLLAAEDVGALAEKSNQWFRKRFAMMRDSGILDNYSVQEIVDHSQGYEVDIQVDGSSGRDKIVFPADKPAAKRLLQFLNEEIFRGAITETLYETNSKREAD